MTTAQESSAMKKTAAVQPEAADEDAAGKAADEDAAGKIGSSTYARYEDVSSSDDDPMAVVPMTAPGTEETAPVPSPVAASEVNRRVSMGNSIT